MTAVRTSLLRWPVSGKDRADLFHGAGGRCMICGEPPAPGKRGLAVDHCHASGHVRGVVCQPCNVGLGGFRDRIDLLHAAIGYLSAANLAIAEAECMERAGVFVNRRSA